MPYSDPDMGAVTLGYSLTTTEDSEPSSEITVESQERLVMLRYKIDDIRMFFDNDIRFLNNF